MKILRNIIAFFTLFSLSFPSLGGVAVTNDDFKKGHIKSIEEVQQNDELKGHLSPSQDGLPAEIEFFNKHVNSDLEKDIEVKKVVKKEISNSIIFGLKNMGLSIPTIGSNPNLEENTPIKLEPIPLSPSLIKKHNQYIIDNAFFDHNGRKLPENRKYKLFATLYYKIEDKPKRIRFVADFDLQYRTVLENWKPYKEPFSDYFFLDSIIKEIKVELAKRLK